MAGSVLSDLERAKLRLMEWGEWQRSLSGACAAGYSGKSNFVPGCGGGDSVVVNPAAEEVEEILCRLKQESPKVVNVLQQCYVQQSSNEAGAGRCRMSSKTFKDHRARGEFYVCGVLAGRQKN